MGGQSMVGRAEQNEDENRTREGEEDGEKVYKTLEKGERDRKKERTSKNQSSWLKVSASIS